MSPPTISRDSREDASVHLVATLTALATAAGFACFSEWLLTGCFAVLGGIFLVGYTQALSDHEFEE